MIRLCLVILGTVSAIAVVVASNLASDFFAGWGGKTELFFRIFQSFPLQNRDSTQKL